jgi:hypothetical protein
VFVFVLLVTGCFDSVARPNTNLTNTEYGFSVSLPEGLRGCVGTSGSHPHGVYARLDNKSCTDGRNGPSVGIWADYNASFEVDALVVLQQDVSCSGVRSAWVREGWQRIDGLKTAMCQVEHSDGRIELVLSAQAGKWGPGFTDNEDIPLINYRVHLGTSKSRLSADLKLFRSFVESIKISKTP